MRKRLFGVANRPRISVFRSLKGIFVQAIDDYSGKPICGLSSKQLLKQVDLTNSCKKVEISFELGKAFGKKLLSNGISQAVFDRNGYKYHGRVKALCDGLREAGIKI